MQAAIALVQAELSSAIGAELLRLEMRMITCTTDILPFGLPEISGAAFTISLTISLESHPNTYHMRLMMTESKIRVIATNTLVNGNFSVPLVSPTFIADLAKYIAMGVHRLKPSRGDHPLMFKKPK